MAKTKKINLTPKTKKIILYSSVGLIAVYVLMRLVGKKDDSETNESNEECAGRYKDNSEYGQKVMKLQEKVGISGCDVDGVVGRQTNGAVKAKYPKMYARYGAVTALNVDKYLNGDVLEAQETSSPTASYTDKVKELQRLLGFPANLQTGNAPIGGKTNTTLQTRYPTYFRNYGNVSVSNIDRYLQLVRTQPVFGQ